MDPFTALGLAGNIITFVDFTWKLLSGAQAIHRSQSGTSGGNSALEAIARDVSSRSDAVVVEQAHSEHLETLAAESKRVAGELLNALEQLKVKGPKTRWNSLKVALREVWSHDEIDRLEQRLSKLQAQVAAHVQHLMGSKMSEIAVAVGSLVKTSNLLRLDMKKLATMESTMKDILDATKALQSGDGDGPHRSDLIHALSLAIPSLSDHARALAYEQNLLGSLHFPMIQARHEKIEKAHADTYEWIFRNPLPEDSKPTQFVEWLEWGNGIFFICGKPGSGKSTLMKFICNHAKTHEYLGNRATSHCRSLEEPGTAESGLVMRHNEARKLREACEDGGSLLPTSELEQRLKHEADLIASYYRRQTESNGDGQDEVAKLVTAKYFFWNAGSKLQKSQEGLLRSLLFDVLHQCPELIDHIRRARNRHRGFAENFEEPGSFAAALSWSFDELLSTLQDVISVRVSATFCFFVDGLDEYEEENKQTYRDLIDTLHRITQAPNAKMCASSRPWTVFLDAFQSGSAYSLKLEDLTRGDIRRYAADKFEEHEQYQRLMARDPSYEYLIEEVAMRAQGVFLWVYLVVRDILDGLTYNDSIQTMLRRLDQLPDDLEDFFLHMIKSIPPLYRHQAARTFKVTMLAPDLQLLMLHSFLDDVEADPDFCLKMAQSPLEPSELTFRHERMRRQLEGWTKGLIEVVRVPEETEPYFRDRVDFLHRTVKDFLDSSTKVQSFLTRTDDQEEDVSNVWVLLCRAVLAEIRYAPLHPTPSGFGMLLKTSTFAARRKSDTQFLREFVCGFLSFAEMALQDANNKNAIIPLFKAVENAWRAVRPNLESPIPEWVCTYGLLELLEHMDYDWSNLHHPDPFSNPLLRYALFGFGASPQRQVDLVTYLLGLGANPNGHWVSKKTIFQEFVLENEWLSFSRLFAEDSHAAFQIVAALVAHGADLSGKEEAKIKARFSPELATRILRGSPSRGGKAQSSTSNQGGPAATWRTQKNNPQATGRRDALQHRFKQLLGRGRVRRFLGR